MNKLIIYLSLALASSHSFGNDCIGIEDRQKLIEIISSKTAIARIAKNSQDSKRTAAQKTVEQEVEESVAILKSKNKDKFPDQFYIDFSEMQRIFFENFNRIDEKTYEAYILRLGQSLSPASVNELLEICKTEDFENNIGVKKYIKNPNLLGLIYFEEKNKQTLAVLESYIQRMENLKSKFGKWE